MKTFKRVLVAFVILGVCCLSGRGMAAKEKSGSGGQSEQMFQKEITKKVSLKYLLYLPKGYGEKKDQKWPLMLFLHGAGERGDDLNLVKKHGPPKLIDQGKEFPFIVVSPQCPINSWWPEQVDALTALLDEVQSKYAVDADRVYLTGLSMGGFGTWTLAMPVSGAIRGDCPDLRRRRPVPGGQAQERSGLGISWRERHDGADASIEGYGRRPQACRWERPIHDLSRGRTRLLDRDLQQSQAL